MKKCPYCAEEIQDEAILCRYCHSDLSLKVEKEQTSQKREISQQDKTEGLEFSIWKSGAKASGVISILVGIAQFFKPLGIYELIGNLTIGLA